jgi:hypothetical protein
VCIVLAWLAFWRVLEPGSKDWPSNQGRVCEGGRGGWLRPPSCKSHVCELGPTSEPGCRGANCLLSHGSTDTLRKFVSWGLGLPERKSGSLELRGALISPSSPPPTSSPPSQHRRCRDPRRPPRRAIFAPVVVARARGTRSHGHDGGAQPRPQQRRRRARPSPPTARTTFRKALAAHGWNAKLTSRHGSGAELAPCRHGRGTELAPRRHGRKAELASRHG